MRSTIKLKELISQRVRKSHRKKNDKEKKKTEKSDRSVRRRKTSLTKRDKKAKKKEEEKEKEKEKSCCDDDDVARIEPSETRQAPDWLKNPPTAEQKAAFEAFANTICRQGIDKLLQEYTENIRPYLAENWSRSCFDQNVGRNRYRDVICNDATRVVLKDGRGSEYIHANWVRGEPLINEFICTQGPMQSTITDFWRMILMTKASNIVMLCEMMECGRVKCEPYFPTKTGEKTTCGGITVENVKTLQSNSHYVKSKLSVQRGDTTLTVIHHFWKTWPDRSVPRGHMSRLLIRILRDVRFSCRPTVVHCSAGIGRTGTLVAVEMCLMSLLGQNTLNLVNICKKLRDQRMHSIQVESQYIFLAITILGYGIINSYLQDSDALRQLRADYESFLERLDAAQACPNQIRVAKSHDHCATRASGHSGGQTPTTLSPCGAAAALGPCGAANSDQPICSPACTVVCNSSKETKPCPLSNPSATNVCCSEPGAGGNLFASSNNTLENKFGKEKQMVNQAPGCGSVPAPPPAPPQPVPPIPTPPAQPNNAPKEMIHSIFLAPM